MSPGAAAQAVIDPTPYQVWGIWGVLAFVIVLLSVLLWRLFNRLPAAIEAQGKDFVDYMREHRGEMTAAIQALSQTISSGHERMAATVAGSYARLGDSLDRQEEAMGEFLTLARVRDQLSRLPKGTVISTDDLKRMVREALAEREKK